MKKRNKITALGVATAILSHPEVQKQVKKLAEAGFKKAQQWWSKRRSQKKLEVLSQRAKRKKHTTAIRAKKSTKRSHLKHRGN